ncbi:MAG: DMT family transporter [Asgard group archaeon]|nr:DMT family transporter [Asgard group archaeon]
MSVTSIILSIVLGAISYSMLNIGMGLQKKGASSLPKIEQQSFWKNLKNFFTNKTWVIGFTLVQIQWFILTLALDIGSLSIVTPLMSFGMVSLIIFSYFYLKEPIALWEIIGIIGIIMGIIALGLTNKENNELETLDTMCIAIGQVKSIIYVTLLFIIAIILVILSRMRSFRNADVMFGIAAGIFDGLGAIFLKVYMGGADFNDSSTIAASSKRWEWWVFLVLLVTLNATATIFLQVAYQRGKAIIVAPIFTVSAITIPVVGGIIILEEWGNLPSVFIILKICALCIIITGAIVLSLYSVRKKLIHREVPEPQETT